MVTIRRVYNNMDPSRNVLDGYRGCDNELSTWLEWSCAIISEITKLRFVTQNDPTAGTQTHFYTHSMASDQP